jgi:hypothetical protein
MGSSSRTDSETVADDDGSDGAEGTEEGIDDAEDSF